MRSTVPHRASNRRLLLTAGAYGLLAIVAAGVYMSPELALPVLALALGGLFLTTHPHWGILATFVLTMFRLSPADAGPLSTAELLALALLLPLALEVIHDRRIWLWDVPHVRILLGIACVFVVAAGWSLMMHPPPPPGWVDQTWTEPFFFAQSLLFLVYFLYFIKTPRHVAYAVAVFLLVILAAVVDGTGLIHQEFRTPGGRAATTYFEGLAGNANRLGFLCVWGTALLWTLRFRGPAGWWQPLTGPPLLLLPVATLMTGSRSALLQLVVLGVLILLDLRRSSPAQRARALALGAMATVLVLVAVPAKMMLRATNFEAGGPTTIGRITTLRAGLVMIAEEPLFGVGPGNFPWRNELLTGARNSPHNAYLWALVSGGPLLLILYLVLFYRTYRTLQTVERLAPPGFTWLATGLRFNLIVLLAGSAFATLWHSEPCWLLIGLTIVLARITGVHARPLRPTAVLLPPGRGRPPGRVLVEVGG